MIDYLTPNRPAWQPRGKIAVTATAPPGSAAAQFYQSADWWQLRASIMTALQDYPDARESLVQTLRSLGDLDKSNAPTP